MPSENVKKRKHPSDSPNASAKNKRIKKNSKKELKRLHEEELTSSLIIAETNENLSSPFSLVSTKLYIHLPPIWIHRPVEGVHEQLNAFLMRYVTEVDGIVLAHSNLKILGNSARIMYDSPYAHFWISVSLLVWKPVKGSKLSGTINLQSADHIGLLLYGNFNASIPRENIPEEHYTWKPSLDHTVATQNDDPPNHELIKDIDESAWAARAGEWIERVSGESIGGQDGVLEFTVIDLVRANDILTVTGLLPPPLLASKKVHNNGTSPIKKEEIVEKVDKLIILPEIEEKKAKKKKKNNQNQL